MTVLVSLAVLAFEIVTSGHFFYLDFTLCADEPDYAGHRAAVCGSWNARSGRFIHICGPMLRSSMRARCFKEAVETVAFAERVMLNCAFRVKSSGYS